MNAGVERLTWLSSIALEYQAALKQNITIITSKGGELQLRETKGAGTTEGLPTAAVCKAD